MRMWQRLIKLLWAWILFSILACVPLRADDSLILSKETKDLPVQVFADYIVEIWGNVSGGVKRGVRYDGLLNFGLSAETEHLGAWEGGEIMVQGHWYQGNLQNDSLTGVDGAFYISNIEASNAIRFYNIYYGQELFEKRFYFKVGQLAADDDFMLTEFADLFLNAAFGNIPLSININPYPAYPLTAPGVYLSGQPVNDLKIMLGLYSVNTGPDNSGNHGFEWELGGDTGYTLFSQLEFSESDVEYPFTLSVGSVLTIDSQLTQQATGSTVDDQTIYSIYLMWSQTWLEDEQDKPKLGSFFRIQYAPVNKEYSVNNVYMDAGLNLFAPFPGRPDDVFGIAFNFADFSSAYQEENPLTTRDQWIFESSYMAQISDAIQLQPDIQYIVHPQNAVRNSLVIGTRLHITF